MSHKHFQKIEKIFSHPTPSNLDVKKTLHALEHYGVHVETTKNHSAKLFYQDQEEILPLPHDNTFPKDSVVKLRHILETFNLTPETIES